MAPEILADRDLMELLLPALRADFAIHETYTYVDEPPLACPITACGGLEDAEVSFEELAAWRQQTSSAFELRRFKGGHFFVHSEGQALIEMINTKLPQYRHLV
jgi:medium-chain acyl-[acyl-carrier-protein] hydrolase